MSPLAPPTVTAPYDSLESCLNLARTRLNDAIQSLGGDILTDVQPFTSTMVNSAWRKLQAFLANLGYSKYKRKFWAYNMPEVSSTDPSVEVFWSWTQFFDGTGYWIPPTVDVLPWDLIAPLRVSERPSGSNQVFKPMSLCPDGLPEGMKRPWNSCFEWKNDAIYMPGSTRPMDMEVEYAAYDLDFLVTNGVLGNPLATPAITPATMFVPIMRSQSALANYIAAECAMGRDDVDVPAFTTAAETDAKILMNNSDVKLKQRRPVQRRPYARRGGYSAYSTRGY